MNGSPARSLRSLSVVLALALAASGCRKVEGTGRLQYNFIPESLMQNIGKTAYQETLSSSDVEKTGDDAEVLTRVGKRIAKVTKQDYEWRYRLLDDSKTVNAWCMPGGKIAFYTGILPVVENEAGMAFVMGHEVGHAVARHGAERLSQQLTLLGGLAGLTLYIDQKSEMTTEQKALIVAALGAGAEVGIMLPFSRKHESEADQLGLMYMAGAGYPPGESIEVWNRMDKVAGSSVPEFLSTHPSNKTRKEQLRDLMPQAKKRYERHKLDGNLTKSLW